MTELEKTKMASFLQKIAIVLFCVHYTRADIGLSSKSYLPPQEGYQYGAPSVPFPTPDNSYNRPSTVRPPPPSPPPYSPPYKPIYSTPKPIYGVPSYNEEGSNQSPVGQPGAGTGGGEFDHLKQPHVPGMPFDFNYAVKDDYYGTDFAHSANSNGDQVKGEYRVLLPDGRLQIVRYLADWKDGYIAEVIYQGEAKYPAPTNPGTSGGSIGAGGYPGQGIKPQPSPYPSPLYPQPSPSYPNQPAQSYPSQPSPLPPLKPSGNYPKPGFGGSQQVPSISGYPSNIPSSGYPSNIPSSGYPSNIPSSGYPSSIPSSGYPSNIPSSGYPSSAKPIPSYNGGQQSGYGSQQSDYGQQPISGYGSSQKPTGGYSSPAPNYSSGSGSDYGSYK